MALDRSITTSPGSRRALLAAGLGGLLATIAAALGRATPVRAADGEAVEVGGEYSSESVTKISNGTFLGTAIWGDSSGGYGIQGSTTSGGSGVYGTCDTGSGVWGTSNDIGTGVIGTSESGYGVSGSSPNVGVFGNNAGSGQGVWGVSTMGTGVAGNSTSGMGIVGHSTSHNGIRGSSSSSTLPAVVGQSLGAATGLLGYSGGGAAPASPAKTGVYGYAVQDANARGVTGRSTAGQGVRGQATSGIGVYATATTGTALQAEGPVRFKTSGLATIALGTRSVEVNPGTDLTALTKVLALLQGDPGGSTVVQRVAVNPTTNTFRIYLTANSVRAVKVSWFVMN